MRRTILSTCRVRKGCSSTLLVVYVLGVLCSGCLVLASCSSCCPKGNGFFVLSLLVWGVLCSWNCFQGVLFRPPPRMRPPPYCRRRRVSICFVAGRGRRDFYSRGWGSLAFYPAFIAGLNERLLACIAETGGIGGKSHFF